MWYNAQDYRAFKADCWNDAEAAFHTKDGLDDTICRSIQLKADDICERGIEHLIDEDYYIHRCKHKKIAMETVLEEQADQRYFGTFSPAFLAEQYMDVSRQSQNEAYLRGLRDELAALEYTADANTIRWESTKTSRSLPPTIQPFSCPHTSSSSSSSSSNGGIPFCPRDRKYHSVASTRGA